MWFVSNKSLLRDHFLHFILGCFNTQNTLLVAALFVQLHAQLLHHQLWHRNKKNFYTVLKTKISLCTTASVKRMCLQQMPEAHTIMRHL